MQDNKYILGGSIFFISSESLFINLLWLLALIGVVSWIVTGLLYRYAVVNSVMDVPNERSSHSIDTPRGGGLAIVISFLLGIMIFWKTSFLENRLLIGFIGSGLMVAVIGFMDDHRHIAARWRLLVHFAAAGWLLVWLGGMPSVVLFGMVFDFGWFGHLLAFFALAWLVNLYNFMDGIDGIAGIEALSSTLAIGFLFLFSLNNEGVAFLNILMSVSVAGFLLWNFPRAKTFMGDAGSGFLGVMLGGFALYSAHVAPQLFWCWLILLGVFIVDATYTLIRRLLRGDKIYKAHRSHAYQYAARKYRSHIPITLAVLAINLFWLSPWAFAVAYRAIDGVVAMLIAYIPLIWLAWYFHAGEIE